MEMHKLAPRIYHAIFKKQHELFLSFIRIQEYYESPKFKGKIFTLDHFKKWYLKSSNDKNTKAYYTDWEAFNVPSSSLKPFFKGKFNPLSKEENNLIERLKNIKEKKFYIIGTFTKRNKKDLKHEVAHALYYTNSNYKKQVNKILKQIDKEECIKINNLLTKVEGYSKNVLADETQAYILADMASLKRNNIKISKLKVVHKELTKNFIKYYK
ncbi:MAG: hypothetical protein Q7S56_00110 [Nanoarchaeota archaeon]|nr:hypothetical protein [Nanoarchaeota archaeon]